jgi:NADPH-dependent F420 reductase
MEIGVLGATGPAGKGIAARLASVGHDVSAGSRDRARSQAVVDDLTACWDARVATLRSGTNAEAAAARDLVIIATAWDGAVDTAREHVSVLAGTIVLAMANGLDRVDDEFRAVLPNGISISEAIQRELPGSRVVAAFQHVPAAAFSALDAPIESDVIVVGDDDGARTVVLDLAVGIPDLRAFDGGSLANAIGIEAFAAVLLTANIRHRGKGTLRLLGLEGYAGGTHTGGTR